MVIGKLGLDTALEFKITEVKKAVVDDVGPLLKQLATGLLNNALATFCQDLSHTKPALSAGHECLDLVEFAWAEVAGFGVGVDNRVGDDAHAVLPRN